MSKDILVIPDQHAEHGFDNNRADWLSKYIIDTKPEIVVNIGDAADMTSLSSYDKGKRSFQGKSYANDINAHLDFQTRVWEPIKKTKKKMPDRYFFIGNHCQRIDRALDLSPELVGTIGYKDLALEDHYNEIIPYQGDTPGVKIIEGIAFAHYFITGILGRGIGGEHPAYTLLSKNFQSCVQGHTHTLDFAERTNATGKKVFGLVCGVYQTHDSPWAGERNKIWWRGLTHLRNVDDGQFDLECVSLGRLKKEYG
ncbi:MAG TPA: hypothetical protein PLS50_00565 [Candidatus Dojkabacteria bacterium]|nr:hypothetical protein [Candidatus Dojkabacteria bacterium]